MFDSDGDGLISPKELNQILFELKLKLSEEEVYDMVEEADIDGDGFINYKEFISLMLLWIYLY